MEKLAAAIKPIWAESTWLERGRLLKRFLNFCTESPPQSVTEMDSQMVLFLESMDHLKASTRLTYAKALKACCKAIGMHSTPILNLYCSASSINSNGEDIKQAIPISKAQLALLYSLTSKTPRLQLSVWLAWKTASRWGDIATLTKDNFVWQHNRLELEILILWKNQVKNTRAKPFSAIGMTVVKANNNDRKFLRLLVSQLETLQPNQKLCPFSTAQMDKFLKRHNKLKLITGHSFKRAAIQHLTEAALDNPNFDLDLIPLLAKHKNKHTQITDNFIRYNSDKVLVAKALGTQKATVLL
jgi:integrase